jgi:hypothetical protein
MSNKLNLGCGVDYRKGWINTDISKEVKADLYFDCRKEKIPLEDNSCSEAYVSGVLEQILTNEEFVFCLNELWRVTSGSLTVIVPNSKYSITFRDPFDCRHFLEETFQYVDKDSELWYKYGRVYGFKPWKVLSVLTNERGIMTVTLKKCEL